MTNSTCVIVDFDSRIVQIAIFYWKQLKYTICIGRVLLFWSWVRLNNSTNMIYHCKTLKIISFPMVNYHCFVVDSYSTTAQFGLLIAKHLNICHLQWNIVFVLLLSLTQQQHKLDSRSQKTWKYVFCNDIFHWCYCWFWLDITISLNYHWKRPQVSPYQVEEYFCLVVELDYDSPLQMTYF